MTDLSAANSDVMLKPKQSKALLWTGRVVSALPALMLLMGGVMNLVKPQVVVDSTIEMGYRESVIIPLGVVTTLSVILYIVPPTAVLGAILLTGYLGGAVATHVIHGDGWVKMLFPVVFGIFIWLGLVLRDPRIRSVLPIRSSMTV